MFQEYPKALYKQGQHVAAENEKAEELLRKDGWKDWHADQEEMQKPKRKKAE
jgi:hypothetical protein